ncbi:MAG: hypothetical protein KAT77_05680 [Nanoarchaeota archaeon]|nr:hypothetical protein [Nanoarchaeota archaeon]
MTTIEEIKNFCKDLSPPDVDRAIDFNELARDESIIAYEMFLEQKKVPRQIFIQGYNAMYAAAALFLVKKYKIKLDETFGSTHKNMRTVLDFYTQGSEHHTKLIELYEAAVDKFQFLLYQYNDKSHFARKVVKDLIDEGFYQGKKITYYSDVAPGRKDPLQLTPDDAKTFIEKIVEPFLFILEELTNA